LMIGFEPERTRTALAERGKDIAQVAAKVREAPLEMEIEHDVDQCLAQALLQRVVAAGRRWSGVDVRGGNHRAHENETGAKRTAAKRLDRDRVEEGLGALGLLVIDQESDEDPLDLFPQRIAARAVESRESKFALDSLRGLLHAAVVEVDAIARDVLD